jgi:hypothetical protein
VAGSDQEGFRSRKAPRSGGKDLRVRGLAVGSSQLPWAHINLAARLGPVKGHVGLGRDHAYSRDARRSSTLPVPKPGTVARSAGRPLVAGDAGVLAVSTGIPPTVGKDARFKVDGTGLGAKNGSKRRQPRRPSPQRRTCPSHVRCRSARASAQHRGASFFGATVRGAKCTLCSPVAALASDFAALLADRLCAE